jgi:hypothetical protein
MKHLIIGIVTLLLFPINLVYQVIMFVMAGIAALVGLLTIFICWIFKIDRGFLEDWLCLVIDYGMGGCWKHLNQIRDYIDEKLS